MSSIERIILTWYDLNLPKRRVTARHLDHCVLLEKFKMALMGLICGDLFQ